MAKRSYDSKAIIKRAKEGSPAKQNYTFRLRQDLMDQFEKICEQENVKRTAVLEEFLKQFTNSKD
ncbi:MAG: hypothetical protein KDD35_05835 [Bdellovibrionales bacterium]|nr:hypothetical protein [Bdellovibrionales bacterium]